MYDTACEFVTVWGWANNEIKSAVDNFLNIDLAALKNVNSCVAIKLWNNYNTLREQNYFWPKNRKVTQKSTQVEVKSSLTKNYSHKSTK